jgi:hypothetical protein
MPTYREQAVLWAKEQLKNGSLIAPIKINAWEIIDDPILYLESNIELLEEGTPLVQRMAYLRIRNLKQKLNLK